MKPVKLIDKAFLLKKTSLFGNLDLDLLLTISDKMEGISYKKGATIFKIGQEAMWMYIVTEGIVEIRNKENKVLADILSGDFFGEESLFNEKPRAYEALCKSDAYLLTLSRSHLLAIISECSPVAISLLEIYTMPMEFRLRK